VFSIFFIVKFLILLGLIRLLLETDNPFLCAGIYLFVKIIFSLLIGAPIMVIFFSSILAGALALLYFWLLARLGGAGILFWVVAIVGAFIGLV
jgi:hypothetical protein